jgi:hypothetical protein
MIIKKWGPRLNKKIKWNKIIRNEIETKNNSRKVLKKNQLWSNLIK